MIEELYIEEVRKPKSYHPPLPTKKQRTQLRAERCGRVHVYDPVELFLYGLDGKLKVALAEVLVNVFG